MASTVCRIYVVVLNKFFGTYEAANNLLLSVQRCFFHAMLGLLLTSPCYVCTPTEPKKPSFLPGIYSNTEQKQPNIYYNTVWFKVTVILGSTWPWLNCMDTTVLRSLRIIEGYRNRASYHLSATWKISKFDYDLKKIRY